MSFEQSDFNGISPNSQLCEAFADSNGFANSLDLQTKLNLFFSSKAGEKLLVCISSNGFNAPGDTYFILATTIDFKAMWSLAGQDVPESKKVPFDNRDFLGIAPPLNLIRTKVDAFNYTTDADVQNRVNTLFASLTTGENVFSVQVNRYGAGKAVAVVYYYRIMDVLP